MAGGVSFLNLAAALTTTAFVCGVAPAAAGLPAPATPSSPATRRPNRR